MNAARESSGGKERKRDRIGKFLGRALSPSPAHPPAQASGSQLSPPTPAEPASTHLRPEDLLGSRTLAASSSTSIGNSNVHVAVDPTTQTRPASPAVTNGIIVPQVRTEASKRIFQNSFAELDQKDQDSLHAIVQSFSYDEDGIRAIQEAVLRQKQQCEEKSWTLIVKGHTLSLAAVAGGVAQLLDKIQPCIDTVSGIVKTFQPGVDLAASIDPLYIGLPVAIIKTIASVIVFNHEQMKTLLTGIQTAIFMMTRLRLYLDYFRHVGVSEKAAEDLETQLTESYGLVLAFLAIAQRVMVKGSLTRTMELLWSKEKIDEFDQNCEKANVRLEQAASLCSRDESHKILTVVKDQLSDLKKLDIIEMSLRALDIKVDLARLESARGAAYDADFEEVHEDSKPVPVSSYCTPGTRTALIDQVVEWCRKDKPGQRLYWITGMAGTGKSTLIRTVARELSRKGFCPASFFFRQDIADRKTGRLFVSTITNQLITDYPALKTDVAAFLDQDRKYPSMSLSEQFRKLLQEPLSKFTPIKVIIIVDALDECENEHAKIIVGCLDRLIENADVRVIITSRPESGPTTISPMLKPFLIRLEDVQQQDIESDIRTFLRKRFALFAEKEQLQNNSALTTDWPDDETLEQLVQLTTPLFIFAATMIRYFEETVELSDPEDAVHAVLDDVRSKNLAGMEAIYSPILERAYRVTASQLSLTDNKRKAIDDFKKIVGSILLLQNVLSTGTISALLGMSLRAVSGHLGRLRSVLRLPDVKSDDHVAILHKSFKDFLLTRAGPFQIDELEGNNYLLICCLETMRKTLRRNICNLSAPGTRRADFTGVNDHISRELAYACQYWADHVCEQLQDDGPVHAFLQSYMIYWFEALSWLGHLSKAFNDLSRLQSFLDIPNSPKLSALLADAVRFVSKFRYTIDAAPLQIYCSAIVFSPKASIVKDLFRKDIIEVMTFRSEETPHWGQELYRLQRKWTELIAIASSCGSKRLATLDSEGLVRIWNVVNGEEIQVIDVRQQYVRNDTAMAFSSDGRLLAVPCLDVRGHSVRLWDVLTGQMVLQRRSKLLARRLQFSPDGTRLILVDCQINWASGDSSYEVKKVVVWDTSDGEDLHSLDGFDWLDAISLSQDNAKLILARTYKDRVSSMHYDLRTKSLTLEAEMGGFERGSVTCAAISTDSRLLATTIHTFERLQIWDLETGRHVHTLSPSQRGIIGVALFPASELVATSDRSGAICVSLLTTNDQRGSQLRGMPDQVASSSQDQELCAPVTRVSYELIQRDGLLFSMSHGAHRSIEVRVWDLSIDGRGQCLNTCTLDRSTSREQFVAGTAMDDRLLLMTKENQLYIWNIAPGEKPRQTSIQFHGFVGAMMAIPEQNVLRVWNDELIQSVDLSSMVPLEPQKLQDVVKDEGRAAEFSPDGHLFVYASKNGYFQVWDTTDGRKVQEMRTSWSVYAMKFSPDGKFLHTNAGTFVIGDDRILRYVHDDDPSLTDVLDIKDGWVRRQGREVLWLPSEHRDGGAKYGHVPMATYGSTIAVGRATGELIFLRWNPDALDMLA